MGGAARAEKLSPEERSEIAARAASVRWATPAANYEGEIILGGKGVPCAVLESSEGSPIRLISSAGFMKALERPWKGTYRRTERPNFLQAKNLIPFITKELEDVLTPVEYRTKSGGMRSGYKAEMIPLVCETYLAARSAGALTESQQPTAQACELIMRGLARVAIAAMVDDATGYQNVRARNALAQILEKFIAKELQPWTKTFPIEFYEHIYRLKGWAFDPGSVRRPQVIGHYTTDFVYKRLAPGVIEELKSKNPVVDGRRKHKMFQWLTGEIGHPKLRSHIDGVLALMRVSESWQQFRQFLNKAYRKYDKTELGFDVEVRDKE